MSDEDEFRSRSRRIWSSSSQRARPFIAQALASAQRAGGHVSHSGKITSGRRTYFGRGKRASVQANRWLTGRSRIAVIKTRVMRHEATEEAAPLRLSRSGEEALAYTTVEQRHYRADPTTGAGRAGL